MTQDVDVKLNLGLSQQEEVSRRRRKKKEKENVKEGEQDSFHRRIGLNLRKEPAEFYIWCIA
jgi:hypothetical protein